MATTANSPRKDAPKKATVKATNEDRIGSYLISQGFLLTALEFYQELKEEGQNPPNILRKKFDTAPPSTAEWAEFISRHPSPEDHDFRLPKPKIDGPFSSPQSPSSSPSSSSSSASSSSSSSGPRRARTPSVREESRSVPILSAAHAHEEPKEKELSAEEIALLQYKLRMAEEDIEVMKKKKAEAEDRLKSANITIKELKSARGKSPSASEGEDSAKTKDSNTSESGKRSSIATDEAKSTSKQTETREERLNAPMDEFERKALFFIVRKFLLSHSLKLTAISFDEEVSVDVPRVWDDCDMGVCAAPTLESLFKAFFSPISEDNDHGGNDAKKGGSTSLRQKISAQKQRINSLLQQIRQLQEAMMSIQHRQQAEQEDQNNDDVRRDEEKERIEETETSSENGTEKEKKEEKKDLNGTQSVKEAEKQEEAISQKEDKKQMPQEKKAVEQNEDYVKPSTQRVVRRLSPIILPPLPEVKLDESTRIGQAIDQILALEGEPDSATRIIGECLPFVVKGVIFAKRRELIPIFLTVVQQHPDARTRDSLTRELFNLIKKPTPEDRRVIMDGCAALASLIGDERVETELLPQCWEQISDAIEERRVLVAESCGCLAPFVKPALRSSLILSILQQLIDDSSNLVREAVARNLAKLITTFDNGDKYKLSEEMTLRLLYDRSLSDVVTMVRTVLFPTLSQWAAVLGTLHSSLFPLLLGESSKLLRKIDPKSMDATDGNRLEMIMEIMQEALKLLWEYVITSSPFKTPTLKEGSKRTDIETEAFGLTPEKRERLNTAQASALRKRVIRYVCNEMRISSSNKNGNKDGSKRVIEPWSALEYMVNTLFPSLIETIQSEEALSNTNVALFVIKLFEKVCNVLGRDVTEAVVCRAFTEQLAKSDGIARSRLVPIFVVGVLSNNPAKQQSFMKEIFLQIAMEEQGWTRAHVPVVDACVHLICSHTNNTSAMTELFCRELIVESNIAVRATVPSVYPTLVLVCSIAYVNCPSIKIRVLPREDIERSVVPAVLTVTNDMQRQVMVNGIVPLGHVAVCVNTDMVLEKVNMQIDMILENKTPEVVKAILSMFRVMIPSVKGNFRDQCLLPKLIQLTLANNGVVDRFRRHEGAKDLCDTYRAFSGCVLSKPTVEKLLSALKILADGNEEFQHLKESIEGMVMELTARNGGVADVSISNKFFTSVSSFMNRDEQ